MKCTVYCDLDEAQKADLKNGTAVSATKKWTDWYWNDDSIKLWLQPVPCPMLHFLNHYPFKEVLIYPIVWWKIPHNVLRTWRNIMAWRNRFMKDNDYFKTWSDKCYDKTSHKNNVGIHEFVHLMTALTELLRHPEILIKMLRCPGWN